MMKAKPIYYLLVIAAMMVFASCESLIEVDQPRTQLTRAAVFEDDLTATAAVSDLYNQLTNGLGSGGFESFTYLTSLSSDELLVEAGDIDTRQFYENSILATNAINGRIWQQGFEGIYLANSTIEGLERSDKITATLKDQLLGEALFFRAFHHFYLVNLFGEIPYITSTDYRTNGSVSRKDVTAVYGNIISDLLEAKTLLADDYAYSKNERVRVNKWAAGSLLARAYLYQEDWQHAEEQATTVIDKTSLYNMADSLNKVFLKNSRETIWQLIPSGGNKYVTEGGIFNRGYSPAIATLTDDFSNAFEAGDKRKDKWTVSGTYQGNAWSHPLKYRETSANGTGAEYYTVFRLAEQYLIRAEARAKQNIKLTGPNSAQLDLNVIRNRAGLPDTGADDQDELLAAVEHERRMELFVEWAHRWMDLKRTLKTNAALSVMKPAWDDTDALYPIPYSELQLNSNMDQNLGY